MYFEIVRKARERITFYFVRESSEISTDSFLSTTAERVYYAIAIATKLHKNDIFRFFLKFVRVNFHRSFPFQNGIARSSRDLDRIVLSRSNDLFPACKKVENARKALSCLLKARAMKRRRRFRYSTRFDSLLISVFSFPSLRQRHVSLFYDSQICVLRRRAATAISSI